MSKAYSNDLRQRCVDAMVGGSSANVIAIRFGVAKSSVIKWHQRYRETGSVSPAKIGGYRPFLLEPHRDFLIGELKRTPHLSTDKLHKMLQKRGVNVSRDTVWRFMRREGFSFKKKSVRS